MSFPLPRFSPTNIGQAAANTMHAVTDMFDPSRWENQAPPQPEIADLGLTGEQIQALLAQPYGISEYLKESFPHLVKKSGKLGAVLKASFVFEHLRRECSFEEFSQSAGCTCNTGYQYMLKVQKLWQQALGLNITLTQGAAHLTDDGEVALRARRLAENALKLSAQCQKLSAEASSVERATGVNLLGPATQNLLNAVLDNRLGEEVTGG